MKKSFVLAIITLAVAGLLAIGCAEKEGPAVEQLNEPSADDVGMIDDTAVDTISTVDPELPVDPPVSDTTATTDTTATDTSGQ